MIRKAAPALCAALLALALGAGPARAAELTNHPFRFSISEFEPEPNHREFLEDPCGIALDSSGDIYVADYYHNQVVLFSPSGGYLGRKVNENPVDGPCGLAVDGGGNLYVNNYHRNVVKFTPAEFSNGTGTVIDSSHPTGVAVDPATGNVFVDARTFVAEYEPSGHPVEVGGQPLQIGLDSLGDYYGVAVSSFPATAGDVYVADAATNTVKAYDPATILSEPSIVIDGAGTPQGGFNSLFDSSVTVDGSNGHLFVADNTQPGFEHPAAVVDEFNAQGEYRGQLPHPIVDGEPTGLAVDAGGNVYATSGNWEGAALDVFGPGVAGHRLEVAKSGAGEGTVSSQPAGIACGLACAAEYDAGARVTLTATPAAGSAFVGWTGCGTESGAECTATMGTDHLVEAEFEILLAQPLALGPPASVLSTFPAAADLATPAALSLHQRGGGATSALVRVELPSAGTLSLRGRGLRSVSRQATSGGETFHLRLDRAGVRTLARSKRGELAVDLHASFRPSGGGDLIRATDQVVFRQTRKGGDR